MSTKQQKLTVLGNGIQLRTSKGTFFNKIKYWDAKWIRTRNHYFSRFKINNHLGT